jgi:hypothetical protein
VVGGQFLIKATKIRGVINKVSSFSMAINAFKLEYNTVPGDMAKAYAYWGADCDTTPSRCNGDGNGAVFWGNQGGGNIVDNESLRFAQHLSLAGLVGGSYSPNMAGVSGCNPGLTHVEVLKNVAFEVGKGSSPNIPFKSFDITGFVPGDACYDSFFTPREMHSLDSKMDDGLPNSGKLNAWTRSDETDVCDNNTDEYDIASNAIKCSAAISLDW